MTAFAHTISYGDPATKLAAFGDIADEAVQTDQLDKIRDGPLSFQTHVVVRKGAAHAIPADANSGI